MRSAVNVVSALPRLYSITRTWLSSGPLYQSPIALLNNTRLEGIRPNFFHILPKSTANFPSIITVRSVTPSAMNWEARACPCLCLQLERASGHAVSKDPNPTTSLPRGPPILDERRTNSWPLNVPTCSHNLPIDPEARPLSTLPYYQLIWILKVYTAGVYSPSQFITRAINEGAGMPYPENHIADIHDDDSTAACLSDSESMYETMSPGFTTVCGLTIYPSPLI